MTGFGGAAPPTLSSFGGNPFAFHRPDTIPRLFGPHPPQFGNTEDASEMHKQFTEFRNPAGTALEVPKQFTDFRNPVGTTSETSKQYSNFRNPVGTTLTMPKQLTEFHNSFGPSNTPGKDTRKEIATPTHDTLQGTPRLTKGARLQKTIKISSSSLMGNTEDSAKEKTEGSRRTVFGSGRIIKLLDKDLRLSLLTTKVDIDEAPNKKPIAPDVLTKATEKIAVGFTTDNQKIKTRGRGNVNRCRAGKIVYLTAKRSYNSLEMIEKEITEAAGLHLHDEDGLIVGMDQVVYMTKFNTREKREKAAMELQERHRIARNLAIPGYKRQVLEWRKERKLWEWKLVDKLWADKKKAVFPKNASRELIDDCAPTVETPEGLQYATDSEIEYMDDDNDEMVKIEFSSSNDEKSPAISSRSISKKKDGKPARKIQKIAPDDPEKSPTPMSKTKEAEKKGPKGKPGKKGGRLIEKEK